ncbi:MAG: hypothetical protein GY820_28815 [Gammaproteobacteria bacterium]|nr:hypothetical protein [Gammaproteobacteria bacterium]
MEDLAAHESRQLADSKSFTLGGPGVIVELVEAKFDKRKYNKASYR